MVLQVYAIMTKIQGLLHICFLGTGHSGVFPAVIFLMGMLVVEGTANYHNEIMKEDVVLLCQSVVGLSQIVMDAQILVTPLQPRHNSSK
jgi:hypothetical protein